MTPCVVCQKREPESDWIVDRGCLNRIDDDLARILELTNAAAMWSLVKEQTGEAASGGVAAEQSVLNIGVLDAQNGFEVLPWLESWERLVREHFGLARYGTVWPHRKALSAHSGVPVATVTIRSSVGFLRAQLARIAEAPDFPIEDMASEVKRLAGSLYALVPDKRCEEHTRNLGDKPCRKCDIANGEGGMRIRCPADHPDADGRRCHYTLHVDPHRPADDVTCPRCHTAWTSARLLLDALNDTGMTMWAYPADIAVALGIPSRTLRQWHADGEIRKKGTQYDAGAAYRKRHA